MATGEDRPKYTHYSLAPPRAQEPVSCLYALRHSQNRSFPTNLLQCLELDRVTPRARPDHYRQQYVSEGLAKTNQLYSQNVVGHSGCVNAINFSNQGEDLLVTGGDDEKVLVWRVADIMRGVNRSVAMETPHCSNIFSATFSCDNSYIYSGGNDADLIKHDATTGKLITVHPHSEAVYSVSSHPFSSDIIVSASEDGLVRIIDTRLPRITEDMTLAEEIDAFQCATFNPVEPCLVATGSSRHGTALFDTRTRKKVFNYSCARFPLPREDVVSVCFSRNGTHLFTMQRRQPAFLFETSQPDVKVKFVDESGGYMNSVTMKSGCFLGSSDEFVASGSDDFMIYIWKIPQDVELQSRVIDRCVDPSPHLVLPGHRSIANQVRYSPTHHLICSSGVEKVVKLWSHLYLSPGNTVQHSGAPPPRKRYSRQEFIRLAINEEEEEGNLGHSRPDQEDPSVLAFFDALVDQDERMRNRPNSCSDFDSSLSNSSDEFSSPEQPWDRLVAPWEWGYDSDTTPSSLSPANTSSLDSLWSDESDSMYSFDSSESEVHSSRDSGSSEETEEEGEGEGEGEDEAKRSGTAGGRRSGRRYRGHHKRRRQVGSAGEGENGGRENEGRENGGRENGGRENGGEERGVIHSTLSDVADRLVSKPDEPCVRPKLQSEGLLSQPVESDSQQPSTSGGIRRLHMETDEAAPSRRSRRRQREHREYCAEDFLKPIPTNRFYSSTHTAPDHAAPDHQTTVLGTSRSVPGQLQCPHQDSGSTAANSSEGASTGSAEGRTDAPISHELLGNGIHSESEDCSVNVPTNCFEGEKDEGKCTERHHTEEDKPSRESCV